MLGQVSHVDKCLIAHITLVWTDVVMVTNVIGQLAGLDEPVPGGMIKYKRKKERKKEIVIYLSPSSSLTKHIHKGQGPP